MKKHYLTLFTAVCAAAVLTGCGQKEASEASDKASEDKAAKTEMVASDKPVKLSSDNPFGQTWDTYQGIPPFSKVKDEHFMPAFQKGLAEMAEEIDAIANNPDPATFTNTIAALERSGKSLTKVASVFFNITNTDTNPTLNALEVEISPLLSKARDSVVLNDAVWQRVNTLYESRDTLDLATDQMRVLELYHRDFTRAGAALEANAKARMSEINAQLSTLTTQYGQNLLAETKGFELIVTDEADLDGLSSAMIAAAKAKAEAKGQKDAYIFGLDRSVYEGFMTSSTNRELKEQLFQGYINRGMKGGDADNRDIALKIAQLRAEAASLRGYQSHAHYQLETRMAKTPEQAEEFLLKVWRPGLAKAKVELADMQALVGDAYTVRASDWWHLSEKVRQDRFNFDDSQLKPYFELNKVRAGAFLMANKLWGIKFRELTDVPQWNPVVTSYEVTDADGSLLGIFMMDMYARDSKRGGAWMSGFRSASKIDGNVRPIITNNMNLPTPGEGEPTLMAFGEVETLFHEFGHGLHGLLTQERYERTSGVSGPRDYTEFPAQILEHWASAPQMLAEYATHYETGEAIPLALVEKLKQASTHNQGFKTTEFIAASLLDLRWHMLTQDEANKITDAEAFEAKVLAEYGLLDEIQPRYRSGYFSHIFAGGYSAGYYAYLWSEILDADGFDAFLETGDIFDPELAKRLRENVYEAGSREEADELYRKFRGKDPSIEPLLRVRGLDDGS